ncbi:MAG: hypothetical protein PWQ54_1181 [Bacteroidales bacterium]|jgi:hypothetical protein|nr:hypothetical protein [Bacteroidales bacterium]
MPQGLHDSLKQADVVCYYFGGACHLTVECKGLAVACN